MGPGRVYLVGAGPGAPDLLTVRGARLLAAADCVFHDALVPAAILELAGPGAELFAVGHRAGRAKRPVADVAAAMAERARGGLAVVRLKGGDPFVFGRGAEEAEALLREGVAFEVVPGISSAIAAAGAAGIPVTHREWASSVAIVTGHEREGSARVRWEALATAADTLVVLMGGGRLEELAAAIIRAGRDPGTPAAVIASATRPEQRQVISTLAGIPEAAAAAELAAPSVLVVGPVVRMASIIGGNNMTDLLTGQVRLG